MPTTATNNPLFFNALYGYGYGAPQGANGQPVPPQGQRAQAPAGPAVQAFGGCSGFERAGGQGVIRGGQSAIAGGYGANVGTGGGAAANVGNGGGAAANVGTGGYGANVGTGGGAAANVGTGAQGNVGTGAGADALGGGADAGGLSPQLVQSLQSLVGALTQVVQQLGTLIQSLGGGAAGAAGAGAGGVAGGAGGGLGGAVGNAGGGAEGAAGGAGGAGNGGIVPPGVGGAGGYGGGAPGEAAQGINPNVRYQDLSTQQRDQMSGMTEEQRAVMHLWGIQMGSSGHEDGGVYLNVLQHPENFKPAEVGWPGAGRPGPRQYGGYTGKSLDKRSSASTAPHRPGHLAALRQRPHQLRPGPVNTNNRTTGQNGLSNFDNDVMQLWGHSPLFTGAVDGSILDYSLNSANRLEVNVNKNDLTALKQADLASDGVVNGDSLKKYMVQVLDHIYLGGPSASVQGRTMNEALVEASQRRDGLLPPPAPEAQGINPQALAAMNAAIASGKGASSCPFLNGGGAALQAGGAGGA